MALMCKDHSEYNLLQGRESMGSPAIRPTDDRPQRHILRTEQAATPGLSAPKRPVTVGAALVAVYLVWGSTYLALRFGLEGFPPFLLNGIRFLVAGGSMYAVLRVRGVPPPTRQQWWNAARMGVLMLVGGVGLVTIAEDLGVGSGVVATAVGVIPLWAALVSGLFGRWPVRAEWIGLIVGFAGVMVLVQEGDFRSSFTATALVVIAPMLWAFGSVWGSRLELPRPAMATAAGLLAGGVVLSILGPLRGERIVEFPPVSAWLALSYLTVMGSIVAYSAYVYLLRTVRPALATSYAYVNPVVAIALGITLGGETLTGPAIVALPLILLGVALVAVAQRRLAPVQRARRRRSSEVVTFLFTDVEGSTRLWEEDPAAMHTALTRHDEILRTVIDAHGGHVFSKAGDSFAAVFPSAQQAAASALEAQLAVAAASWGTVPIRLRMALHTGTAAKRDGRYFGPSVNRTARLVEAGHGGQVLVSLSARRLLEPSTPDGSGLVDLGEHWLRDLRCPERVFQLTHPELRFDFPPLRRLKMLPSRPPRGLPAEQAVPGVPFVSGS